MAKANIIGLLKKVDLFSILEEAHLEILAGMSTVRTCAKDEVILVENDRENQSFFVIASGQVKVFISGIEGKEALLALLKDGEFFGEMSLIDGEPRSASVRAVVPSELVIIRREDFIRELKEHPELSMQLLIEMSHRIRRADRQISSLALMSVYGRIASAILRLMEEKGEKVRMIDGSVITVVHNRPSHKQLADLSGTTRETVSRALAHLQSKGFISLSGKEIYIFQESALKG